MLTGEHSWPASSQPRDGQSARWLPSSLPVIPSSRCPTDISTDIEPVDTRARPGSKETEPASKRGARKKRSGGLSFRGARAVATRSRASAHGSPLLPMPPSKASRERAMLCAKNGWAFGLALVLCIQRKATLYHDPRLFASRNRKQFFKRRVSVHTRTKNRSQVHFDFCPHEL